MANFTPPTLNAVRPNAHPVAPRMRGYTDAESWYKRAEELAHAQHMDYAIYFAGIFDGDILYLAPSVTNPQMRHKLRLNLEEELLSCDCIAHAHGYPCAHIGALHLLMRRAERSALPQNLRGQMQFEDWANSAAG